MGLVCTDRARASLIQAWTNPKFLKFDLVGGLESRTWARLFSPTDDNTGFFEAGSCGAVLKFEHAGGQKGGVESLWVFACKGTWY